MGAIVDVVWSIEDPWPACQDEDNFQDPFDFEEYTSDGRLVPPPCIICGMPAMTCTGDEN